MVFTTRLSGGRGGRNGFETLLDTLGVVQKNSRPNHPTTCGKVERFHHTLKKWLRTQPAPPPSPPSNANSTPSSTITTTTDPHRSLPHRATPHTAYTTRPKATPTGIHYPTPASGRDRVNAGNVTLRVGGQLHHIGIGRPLDRTPILMLIDDLDVRVIHATTGEIIRTLTINPNRRYHGTGKPTGGPKRPPKTKEPEPLTGVRTLPMSRDITCAPGRIRTCAHGSGGRCSIP